MTLRLCEEEVAPDERRGQWLRLKRRIPQPLLIAHILRCLRE